MTSVAAVVVDFFAGDDLARCVDSLRQNGVEMSVVVDNSTTGASLLALGAREARVVDPESNLGFGRGVNRGVAALGSADVVIVANPDVVVHDGAIAALVDYLDRHGEVALVGPAIVDGTGAPYPSARVFPNPVLAALHAVLAPWWPSNPFTRRYRSPGKGGRVDWVSGAFFAIRRADFEAVGGFDERYFMFAEDMDLCWRLGRRGRAVAVCRDAVVTHHEGVSRRRAPRAMLAAHHRSAIRFEITTARGARRLLVPLAVMLLGLRYLATAPFSPRGPLS